MKTIFAILGLVLTLMLVAGCGEPSKKTCKQAIKPVVEERIPIAWRTSPLGDVENIRVKKIKIIKIGDVQTNGTKELIPVEAQVNGYYNAEHLGWSRDTLWSFYRHEGKFFVYKDSYGDWKAQYQELDKDSRIIKLNKLKGSYVAYHSNINYIIASLVDLVNKTFYQKQFRERREFESPEQYQQEAQLFWKKNRALYRAKLQSIKLPLLQPDKTVIPSDYKTFRFLMRGADLPQFGRPAEFQMSEYNFQDKSFKISVDFKEVIDFDTVVTSGVNIYMQSTTSTYKVPPIPIVGHFTSVYLREEDVERAKQIKSDHEAGNLNILLDFALYAIDLKILGINHRKLDVYPLVLQFLSGKIYNTKTDSKCEKPLLTWKCDKSVYRVVVKTVRGPLAKRSVVFSKNFADLRLSFDEEGRFPVLQGDKWDY